MLKDNLVFLQEFVREFQSTGTFFPSSKWAAEALAKPVSENRTSAMNILEVGPGSGPVTVKLLRHMTDQDRLTVCEINPRFMAALREKVATNPDYLRHKERISFFEGPVQDLPEDLKYDVIVCALPFLNFELPVVQDIFHKFSRLARDGATMTYFEYIGLRSLNLIVPLPERRRRMKELDRFFKHLFGQRVRDKTRIWLNLLPINVYTIDVAA